MVGLIIGRGGDTLKRIEQVTGTKVQFASSELGHSEPIRRVTVQGPLDGIKEARAMIQKVMDASSDGGVAIPAAPTAIPAALPSVSYKIPNHKVGLAIGRGGETIKMLQDRSGAKVFIAPDHSVKPGESDRHVSIAGDEASIARAKTLLNELVTHGTMEGTYYASAGGSGGMAITLPPGALTDVCEVPNDAAGVVIGKNGETVKWLMQQTGARIQVEQPTVQSAMRKIHLSGTPETIAAAKALIMEQVAAKSRGEPSGPAMYGDASAVGLYDAYGAYGGGYDYSAYYAQYGQAAGTGEAGGEYAYAPYAQQAGGDYAQYMQQPGEYAPYAQQQPGQQGEYDYAAYYAYYQQQPPPPPPM
jgi:far upstream element-binding protein